ncbi:MAG: LysR family transcriptional regulator [Bradymonadia bacterium]
MANFTLDNWDDLRLFLIAVRAGSISAAARWLSLDPTTVSRRLSAFETHSGVKLFERLRGGIVLTPVGETIHRRAEAVEMQINAMEREAARSEMELEGVVRVTLPEVFAYTISKGLQDLSRRLPRVSLEILGSETLHSLSKREADIALRVTDQPPEHLYGRRLGPLAIAAYGSASLAGQGVKSAPWVGWAGYGDDEGTTGRMRSRLGATGPYILYVSTYGLLMRFIRDGAGLAALPCILCDGDPDLMRFSTPELLEGQLWLLTHPDLKDVPRVKAVMQAMAGLIDGLRAGLMG